MAAEAGVCFPRQFPVFPSVMDLMHFISGSPLEGKRYSANSLGAGMAAGLLAIISAAAIQVFLIRKLDSRKRL